MSNTLLDGGGATEPLAAAVPRLSAGPLLARLRQATLESHERVDLAVSKLQLEDTAGYGAFLNLHCSVLRVLQPNWRIEDAVDFGRFVACLDADLGATGIARLKCPVSPLCGTARLGQIGLAYVIRGSRLGAKFLRRRVPASFASTYLDCPVSLTWPEFLRQLDQVSLAGEPAVETEVIEGAQRTFELFLQLITRWPTPRSQ